MSALPILHRLGALARTNSVKSLIGSVYLTETAQAEQQQTSPFQELARSWPWLPNRTELKGPRHPVVLCHGLGFFDKTPEALPRFQLHYWGGIVDALRALGTEVIIARVPSTGTIAERSRALHRQLEDVLEPGQQVNLLAHSMGGLDCRHLITHIKPTTYKPVSLITLSCPHRGSPFMDWCRDYLIDKAVPLSSAILTKTMLARMIDCPAYANLTTAYCQKVFNPLTPDSDEVAYYSFAASAPSAFPIWHPLYLPHLVVSEAEGKSNDGLVSVDSSRWGKFVDTVDCDHWDLRGRGLPGSKFQVVDFYRAVAAFLYSEGF
ncbi:Alpha/Beta hydrolase protein [Protomyces lactucae-debilis]|uniref:Alpha/Beta hydrolase protein n=1 Tax=Protomyces lactucae-debilis TaxID=2754530 RepID=A0A1Y2FMG1_PROLT|nr:Alpha/Beta hydrolase protein [Protomyces lactucae-debilis]ORY85119.1 Alpha/Beta hydrolase protein [Protomyces lactucae-debilis]